MDEQRRIALQARSYRFQTASVPPCALLEKSSIIQMPSRNKDFQISPRSQINAIRRRNFKIQMILLMIPVGILTWALIRGRGGEELVWLFGSIIAFVIVSALIDRSDVCPTCRQKISSIPNGGLLWLPGLSRKVHACPFCGEDFDRIQEEDQQAGASDDNEPPNEV